MDFVNLAELFNGGFFCDLSLLLDDGENQLDMNVHRIILSAVCPYFLSMLTTTMSESQSDKIRIYVPNVYVAKDIVQSFYGKKTKSVIKPDWEYFLLESKCRNYFGLEMDIERLINLTVPSEGFDLLLDVLEIVGNDSVLPTIMNNLPKNYDLGNFSKELLEQLNELICDYQTVYIDGNKIIIRNNIDDKTIYTHTRIHYSITSVCNINAKQLIIARAHDSITILDIKLDKIITTFPGTSNSYSLVFVPNKNQLVFIKCNEVYIHDITTTKLVTKLNKIKNAISIVLSPDKKEFAVITFDKGLYIVDMETHRKTHRQTNAQYLCYSPDNSRFITVSGCSLCVYFNHDKKLFKSLSKIDFRNIISIEYHKDNNHFLVVMKNKTKDNVKVYDLDGGVNLLSDTGNCRFARYSPNYKHIFVEYVSGIINIYDVETNEIINTKSGTWHNNDYEQIHFICNKYKPIIAKALENKSKTI